jgi:hypothetical protein
VSERDPVRQAFDRFGRDAGFEKKSGSWYRHGDGVIAISNLQKSQYGPEYYFNQGFCLRQLDDEPYPKPNEAHVVTRLEDLMPEPERRIGELLDLDYEMPEDQRVDEILAVLTKGLLPLIERASSVVGLRTMVDDGTFAGAAIRGPAQEALATAR